MNTQIYEEASEWLVSFRLGEVGADARRRFDAWMRASPEHLRAYLEVAAIWNEGGALDAGRRYTVEELIEHARSLPDTVVPFQRPGGTKLTGASPGDRRAAFRYRRFAIAASLVALLIAGVLVGWSLLFGARTYVTETGERRSVVLADGSRLELNARSRVRYRMTGSERRAELLEGQALFTVAHDPARPFVVRSGRAEVRAIGTQFDVKRSAAGRTVVTVTDGRVEVQTGSARTWSLSSGERIAIDAGGAVRTSQVDVETALAWTQGRLVFQEAPIEEVVEEFNRHNVRQIVIDGIGISHISGVFSSTDPSSLVQFFRQRPDVRVTETESEIRISGR